MRHRPAGTITMFLALTAAYGCSDDDTTTDARDGEVPDGREDGPGADADAEADGDADADADAEADGDADADADGSDTVATVCGDGLCEGDETCGSCVDDCCRCPTPAARVDDALTSEGACSGTRSGGAFGGAGWSSTDLDSRIVYDLVDPLDCGSVRLHVGPFDPQTQYVHGSTGLPGCPDNGTPDICTDDPECYDDFLALFQGPHGDHHAAAANGEAYLLLKVLHENPGAECFRNPLIKMMAITGIHCPADPPGENWCGAGNAYSSALDWSPGHDLCLGWDATGARLFVDGALQAEVAFTWDPAGSHRPAFRYVFLARTRTSSGGWLDGATYANLVVEAGGACP